MPLVALVLLAGDASASRVLRHDRARHVQGLSVSSVPMYMYKRDCWKKRHWSFAQKDAIPGAGMNLSEIEPFKEVLKDGYYTIDCVKDYMLEFGDHHGKNKFQYNQGDISAVSVVRYSDIVPKTDQEEMSHSVCFAFCRGVPDMTFFGIKNGRDCYCAPYYKEMAGDSSMCDAVCPGEPTLMCGGKSKSSIFSMHSCATTGKELSDAAGKAASIADAIGELSGKVTSAGDAMEAMGAKLKATFSETGDAEAAELMHSAKVFAGELLAAAAAGDKLKADLAEMETKAEGMAGADFAAASDVSEAEALTGQMEAAVAEGEVEAEELGALLAKAQPEDNSTESAAGKQYVPIMYFVDKAYQNMSTTCGGTSLSKPLLGSIESCAVACDSFVGECAGFSYTPEGESGLCFLFSKFKVATYYTGCEGSEPLTQCQAKFSQFSGTTLKPDPSGKCKQCLKEATEFARCFKT
jgi:hypothetical protein